MRWVEWGVRRRHAPRTKRGCDAPVSVRGGDAVRSRGLVGCARVGGRVRGLVVEKSVVIETSALTERCTREGHENALATRTTTTESARGSRVGGRDVSNGVAGACSPTSSYLLCLAHVWLVPSSATTIAMNFIRKRALPGSQIVQNIDGVLVATSSHVEPLVRQVAAPESKRRRAHGTKFIVPSP